MGWLIFYLIGVVLVFFIVAYINTRENTDYPAWISLLSWLIFILVLLNIKPRL